MKLEFFDLPTTVSSTRSSPMKSLPRRQFIRQTAAAALAAPFISTAVTRALAQAAEKKIGFAVCGLGSLSRREIGPALQQTKNCRLAGIITGTTAKAERWKAQYELPENCIYNYDTMDRLADNPDIDVVYVVTPNGLHAEHAIKAAKAGKHVLSEKPMEASVEKAQAMIDACKAANRLLAVGYRCRFDPNHLECIRLAREKVFGDLKIIEACFNIPLNGDVNQWRLSNKALSGGGALMDVGIYALQATRYLSGEEPILVSGMVTKTNPERFKEVEETVTWQMKFPGGATAYCSASYNTSLYSRFTATAQKGWFELNPAFVFERNHGRCSNGKEIRLPDVNQFAAEMDDFAQCIRENRPSAVSGEEGLRDLKIMAVIYESIKTGRSVTLA